MQGKIMTDNFPTPTSSQAPPAAAALRGPNMIAVASGKGGVGKTWFSITLCHALAKQGKKILLFDGDLGLANVDIQLGLTPERDLGAVIDGTVTLAGAAMRFTEGGFDILAGRSGSGSLANLPSQRLTEVRTELMDLARTYDNIIVDLGAGIDRPVRQLSGPAGITLVVVTDEPTSLTDAYAFIKVTYSANPSADIRVVINMANSTREGERTYETILKACQSFLKRSPQLAGIIRRDLKVREAIRAQMPLLVRSPTTDAASDVEAIANRLFHTR
jgi:flagellar biosynthesis protein FlhG